MKRRELIAIGGAALVSTRAQAAERVIGWISPESRETIGAVLQGLPGRPAGQHAGRRNRAGDRALCAWRARSHAAGGCRAAEARCQPDRGPGRRHPGRGARQARGAGGFRLQRRSGRGRHRPVVGPPGRQRHRHELHVAGAQSQAHRLVRIACRSAARWRCCRTPAMPARRTTSPPASAPSKRIGIELTRLAQPKPGRDVRRGRAGARWRRPGAGRPAELAHGPAGGGDMATSASPARCRSSRAGRASPAPARC